MYIISTPLLPGTKAFNQDLEWNVEKLQNAESLFHDAVAFNGVSTLCGYLCVLIVAVLTILPSFSN